jgi:poly-gamma-glutamate synthesis protein (capsule biosynthesis protein)
MSSTILIAADIVPTSKNIDKFINGDADYLVGDKLIKRLNAADFIVMNLEVPLADRETPIRKCGPCLIAPTNTINGIKAINPHFLTLANNHILDQGLPGLQTTIQQLDAEGISYAGIGKTLTEARQPYIAIVGGHKVGFYCCAEHEFSIATEKTAGANPFDPLESFVDIKNLKGECEFVVVLYDGGKEQYRYPSPLLRKVFHKFSDAGADLVIAQHTHCIGCKEIYQGSTLVYGQGNFLFDHSDSEFWKTSLLVELDMESRNINYIPLVKDADRVREAEDSIAAEIISGFNSRSKAILKEGFVEEEYSRYAKKMDAEYLLRFSGRRNRNPIVRILNKLTSYRFIKSIYPDSNRIVIENVLECEAHRELAAEIMKNVASRE